MFAHRQPPAGPRQAAPSRHPHQGRPRIRPRVSPRGQLAWVRHHRVLADVFRTAGYHLSDWMGHFGACPLRVPCHRINPSLAFAIPIYLHALLFPAPRRYSHVSYGSLQASLFAAGLVCTVTCDSQPGRRLCRRPIIGWLDTRLLNGQPMAFISCHHNGDARERCA